MSYSLRLRKYPSGKHAKKSVEIETKKDGDEESRIEIKKIFLNDGIKVVLKVHEVFKSGLLVHFDIDILKIGDKKINKKIKIF